MIVTISDLQAILPLLVVIIGALIVLLADLWIPDERKGITALLAAAGLVVGIFAALGQMGKTAEAFNGMIIVDGAAVFLNVLFFAGGLLSIGLAHDYLKRMGIERGDYYPLLMLSTCGMGLMAYAYDLIIVFLALELLSIPLYILSGFARLRLSSEEAALKYFLLGTFSSAFVLMGIAMTFGATSHTSMQAIFTTVIENQAHPLFLLIGAGLLLVGFVFKMGAAPFHMWAPDVYQGAPSPVTGFMSVGAKAAGVAALLRVFIVCFQAVSLDLAPVIWAIAALTMVVGNVTALVQSNIKRLLAYSSIAHGGYMLMAFVPFGQQAVVNDAVASMLFYLLVYAITSFGAWAVVIILEQAEEKGLALDDYAGLARKHPWLAVAMMVFMLSFTGMPLTLGFWGKFYLFRTVVEGGYVGLALVGLITSVVSAYYYLRVIVVMFMKSGDPQVSAGDIWPRITAIAAAVAVVVLSFMPGQLMDIALGAMLHLH